MKRDGTLSGLVWLPILEAQSEPVIFSNPNASTVRVQVARARTDATDGQVHRIVLGTLDLEGGDSRTVRFRSLDPSERLEARQLTSATEPVVWLLGDLEILFVDQVDVASGAGEVNVGANVGNDGHGLYDGKLDEVLEFRNIAPGLGIDLEHDVPNRNVIVSVDPTELPELGEANTASNVGTGLGLHKQKAGVDLEFFSLGAGTAITLAYAADDLVVSVNESAINHNALANVSADEHVPHSSVFIIPGNGLAGGGSIAGNVTLDVVEAAVDHNLLFNYVADEHVPHSNVSILAGNGLAGGGTIAATRTLDVVEAQVDHDKLLNYVPEEHVPHSDVSILAGNGLTGGGDITQDRTLTVGASMSIQSTATTIRLVNDQTSPGASKYYGTNATGTKGYHDLPDPGGGATDLRQRMSVTLHDSNEWDWVREYYLGYVANAVLLMQAAHYQIGGTNVRWQIYYASTRDAASPTPLFAGLMTTVSPSGMVNDASGGNPSAPAGSYIWLELVSVAGVCTDFGLTLEYEDRS